MGRFLYLFPDSKYVEEVLIPEMYFYKGFSVLGDGLAANNLGLSTSIFDSSIEIDTNISSESLLISDIVLGLIDDELYLKDKNTGRKIYVGVLDAINYTNHDRVAQLLKILANQFHPCFYTTFQMCEKRCNFFIPRIVFENIVLSPAKYEFKVSKLGNSSISKKIFFELLEDWKKNFLVPRFIQANFNGVMVMIDLENVYHKNYLWKYLKQENFPSIWFEEVMYTQTENWDNTEYHFHVLKEYNQFELSEENEEVNCFHQLSKKDTNVILIKIYLRKEYVKRFLQVLNEGMLNSNFKKEFFIIQYSDSEFHLRLRVYNAETKIDYEVIDLLRNIQKKGSYQ